MGIQTILVLKSQRGSLPLSWGTAAARRDFVRPPGRLPADSIWKKSRSFLIRDFSGRAHAAPTRRFFSHHQAKPSRPDRPSYQSQRQQGMVGDDIDRRRGPNFRTSSESTSQRTRRPGENRDHEEREPHFEDSGGEHECFPGRGRRSMEGIAMARNSWRSKRSRMASNRSWWTRLRKNSSPPARPNP